MAESKSLVSLAKSKLKGTLTLPPSKSHTLRACLFASMAEGVSTIENYLHSPDTTAMISALRQMGAKIEQHDEKLVIEGGLKASGPIFIDAQNSGQVLRFVGAVATHLGVPVHITGDHSLQTRRPCVPLIDGLCQLGAKASHTNGHAPITVQGPIYPGKVRLHGQDSQPVSALMIAASLLPGATEIEVLEAGEKPWLQLTLSWLKRMQVDFEEKPGDRFVVYGRRQLKNFSYRVPGDLSTLAFPLTIALLTESDLVIQGVELQDEQGDKVLVTILQKMGATFELLPHAIRVQGPQTLEGIEIDVNDCIDALPILAVVGAFAKGKTRLFNGAIARKKESDRISAIAQELEKLGANIVQAPCGLTISQSELSGAHLFAHEDHRIAMALSVAALSCKGNSTLAGATAVKKSYPEFFSELRRLGGQVT